MTAHPAILGGWLYLPKQWFGPADLEQLRQTLTFLVPERDDEPARLIPLHEENRRYLAVPRAWGLQHYGEVPGVWGGVREDRLVDGPMVPFPSRPDPYHPKVRNPEQQARFMADLDAAAAQYETFLASAPTGTGKTVCALNMAANRGRPVMVVVPLVRLADQWAEEAQDKLGLRPDQIGRAQGDRCTWQGRSVVIGIVHSLARRDYGQDFYHYFGTVIFDEVHKLGAPAFSAVAPKFPARVKVGLSATIIRRAGTSRPYIWHLGPCRVTSSAPALPMTVYTVRYNQPDKSKRWGTDRNSMMKCLSLDRARNLRLANIIHRMWSYRRQGLIVSEYIAHLETLMELARRKGVPPSAMGLFVGGKDKEELDNIKENSQLIFATYGMMKEGIDIPRLDAGLDALPRGDATQLIGRIRRPHPDKKDPMWVTILDVAENRCQRYYRDRCRDYRTSGARMLNYG